MQTLVTHTQRHAVFFLTALTLMLTTASLAVAQSPHELRPGVLIDPVQQTGFLMGPKGVDAVRLDLGSLAWHSDAAATPLALHQGYLVARAESQSFGKLELVVLNANDGATLRAVTVELPPTVFAHTGDALGASFSIWADPAQTSAETLRLSWRFEHRVAQGIEPTGSAPRPKIESGSMAFNPLTGNVVNVPGIVKLARRDVLVEKSKRLKNVAGRQFIATKGNHILASQRVNNDSAWNKYRWTLYTTGGQRLGSIDTHASHASFSVVDSLLVYETRPFERREGNSMVTSGPMIRVVDLESGIEQWSWSLRDTAYRGPFPP